jgi:hypothetical protein
LGCCFGALPPFQHGPRQHDYARDHRARSTHPSIDLPRDGGSSPGAVPARQYPRRHDTPNGRGSTGTFAVVSGPSNRTGRSPVLGVYTSTAESAGTMSKILTCAQRTVGGNGSVEQSIGLVLVMVSFMLMVASGFSSLSKRIDLTAPEASEGFRVPCDAAEWRPGSCARASCARRGSSPCLLRFSGLLMGRRAYGIGRWAWPLLCRAYQLEFGRRSEGRCPGFPVGCHS